ncbi:hypothetical protein [Tenacibaculum aiptasiae]|uniref:hypothetical protein n=1 Tax=Tenacibaculum aiptasiae TaxID=426481 RepID=UPI00232E24D9|nr:hypothetical protein [Tenacibaculum aiptasiae]
MKKNISIIHTILIINLFFLVSCSNDNGDSSYTNDFLKIPDTSFESILINQGIDTDGKLNQQILISDAKKVAELDLSSLEFGFINDLTGIEGFKHIKTLIASQHNIEYIDLSNNIFLDTVYLAGNNISSIDLSKNTKLELIDLSANNLNEINGITNLSTIKKINLSFNYLKELNVNNSSLETLHISNNELTSININSSVNLKNLLLTSNQIVSIDINKNTLLETLLISDNKLENINLDNNDKLTHFYVSSNSLSSLDVSSNQNLVDLKVDRNPNLNCIKIHIGQNILTISKAHNQELSVMCN